MGYVGYQGLITSPMGLVTKRVKVLVFIALWSTGNKFYV